MTNMLWWELYSILFCFRCFLLLFCIFQNKYKVLWQLWTVKQWGSYYHNSKEGFYDIRIFIS